MRPFFFLFMFVLLWTDFSAQYSEMVSPEDAINGMSGSSLLVSNVEYHGEFEQVGNFIAGDITDFPFNNSFFLSTGHYSSIACETGYISSEMTNFDLLELANIVPDLIEESYVVDEIFDASFIDFDFVPSGDTLSMEFAFASNEYLTWVNSPFNDVIGVFLSGPGIEGDFSSPDEFPNGSINLAWTPESNSSLPITVSSINDSINNSYYIDNPEHEGVCMNGFTTSLFIHQPITPGETYHLRLAIGDGDDAGADSAFCIRNGSLNSNGEPFSSSISENDKFQTFLHVYPNPAEHWLNLEITGVPSNQNYAVIKDMNGKDILWVDSITNKTAIDVSGLEKGIYLVQMFSGSQVYTERFVR